MRFLLLLFGWTLLIAIPLDSAQTTIGLGSPNPSALVLVAQKGTGGNLQAATTSQSAETNTNGTEKAASKVEEWVNTL